MPTPLVAGLGGASQKTPTSLGLVLLGRKPQQQPGSLLRR